MIAVVPEILSWVMWLALLIVGVVITGLYCGLETGVYELNKFRLDLRAQSGLRSAKLLKRILGDYDNLLAVLLIGTNIGTYAATFAISAMFALGGVVSGVEWYTIAVATPVLFIFGESVPKNVFQRLSERLMYRLSWFIALSGVVLMACGFSPLVRGFSWVLKRLILRGGSERLPMGHEGLAAIVAEGQACGVLTHSQSVMAGRVMGIADVRLSDVMVPIKSTITAPMDISPKQLIELIGNHNYSRLPLVDPRGNVTGILDIYDVLLGEPDQLPAELARDAMVLGGDAGITDALYRMQHGRRAMAIVADADGHHVGIVTVKDLVEEIVGELEAW